MDHFVPASASNCHDSNYSDASSSANRAHTKALIDWYMNDQHFHSLPYDSTKEARVLAVTEFSSAQAANTAIAALARFCQMHSNSSVFYAMHVTPDIMSYDLRTYNGCIAGDKQLCLYVSAHPVNAYHQDNMGMCALVISFKHTAERFLIDLVSRFFNIAQRNMAARVQLWLAACAEHRLRNSSGVDVSDFITYDNIKLVPPPTLFSDSIASTPIGASGTHTDTDSPMPSLYGSGFNSDYDINSLSESCGDDDSGNVTSNNNTNNIIMNDTNIIMLDDCFDSLLSYPLTLNVVADNIDICKSFQQCTSIARATAISTSFAFWETTPSSHPSLYDSLLSIPHD